MTGPRRLFEEDDELKRAILRSSELDVPSARSLRRAHALAVGLASSTVAGVGSAAGSAGGVAAGAVSGSVTALKGIALWAGVGVLSGALVSGTAVTVLDSDSPEPPETRAATAAVEKSEHGSPAAGPVATAPHPDLNRVATEEPSGVVQREPAGATVTSRPAADRPTGSPRGEVSEPSPVPGTVPAQSAARFAPTNPEPQSPKPASAPNDELARELGMVDRARSALRAGNAAGALELVSGYERAFKHPRFAPEATAIRIEALIAQGQRAEAARLARLFMARHPGHPLTPRLRKFVGEP
jgi:hypothetical protein